jgi:hypothetical protein
MWAKLSTEEQAAATALGYDETRWNADILSCLFRFIMTLVVDIVCTLLCLLVAFVGWWILSEEERQAFARVGLTPVDRKRLRDFIVQREGATPSAAAAAAGFVQAQSLIEGRTRARTRMHQPSLFLIQFFQRASARTRTN